VDKWIKDNTLGPKLQSLLLPWARSQQPGYVLGGNRFDLDRWDTEFFARLKDFITQAGRRGIVVEICFFNAQYDDTWPISPLFVKNNVQGEGNCDFKDAQTLKHPDVVRREEDYVRQITREVKRSTMSSLRSATSRLSPGPLPPKQDLGWSISSS
jgi:hypothetical protein